MRLSAFEQANLKSRKVRLFLYLLLFMAVGYALGIAVYVTCSVPAGSMASSMLKDSVIFFGSALMLVLFLVTLRWHILRTAILAVGLIGLAYLYCALVLLLFQSPAAHAVGLSLLSGLFVLLLAKPGTPSRDPLDILEDFAKYASQFMNGRSTVFGNAFQKALSERDASSAT
jgi:hypothetical protein